MYAWRTGGADDSSETEREPDQSTRGGETRTVDVRANLHSVFQR